LSGRRGVIAVIVAAALLGVVVGIGLPSLSHRSGSHKDLTKPDRAKDAQLTPVERAIDALPIREQPLPIAQYVTGAGDADIVARMKARDFSCHRTLNARRSAGASLYRRAAAALARYHVTRSTLAVGLLDNRAEHFMLFAHDNDGIVSLTAAGHAPPTADRQSPIAELHPPTDCLSTDTGRVVQLPAESHDRYRG